MSATIVTSVVTGGSNSHATVSSEANAYATDFISQGVLGSISNSGGVGPGTGSFGVRQDSSPDMGITISGTGNTTNGQSTAYIEVTPTSQDLQVLRARMSSDYTGYTINANSTGSTVYDWIYLEGSATNAATPDSAADNVVTLYTSRSTSNTTDNGSPPTYGILLAVVTVANGASSITNANIADKRTQVLFNTGGVSSTTGWQSLGTALTYGSNAGSREFTVTATADLTGTLSPGMKLQLTRSVTPPSQCAAFVSSSNEYAKIASPSGLTFTSAFTLEAWVFVQSYTGSVQTIVRRDNGTSHGGFAIDIDTTGQVRAYYTDSSGNLTLWETVEALPLNRWIHVAAVISSTSSKTLQGIYFDGTPKTTSNPNTAATSLSNAGTLAIGAELPTGGVSTSYLNGYISELRIWSVAQTIANIQANMAINLTGSETNLVGLWQFNGAWTDATTNANTLTAVNGASNTQSANPFNAIEYAKIRAISFSSTTTITLFTSDAGTIPNQTLNTPQYSSAKNPFGFPQVLNSKVEGQIRWNSNVTTTATATGTILPGATIIFTVPSGGKRLVMKFYGLLSAGAGVSVVDAYWGSTQIQRVQSNTTVGTNVALISTPFWVTSGSQTFTLNFWETSAGTLTNSGTTTNPSWFVVEEA